MFLVFKIMYTFCHVIPVDFIFINTNYYEQTNSKSIDVAARINLRRL